MLLFSDARLTFAGGQGARRVQRSKVAVPRAKREAERPFPSAKRSVRRAGRIVAAELGTGSWPHLCTYAAGIVSVGRGAGFPLFGNISPRSGKKGLSLMSQSLLLYQSILTKEVLDTDVSSVFDGNAYRDSFILWTQHCFAV